MYISLKKALVTLLVTFACTAEQTSATNDFKDENIGFAQGNGPVAPSNIDCLSAQEVFGQSTTIFIGAAVQPTIAVNPRHKRHIVAAWEQDRISNGGALEAGIAYTVDCGKKWNLTTIPLQLCSGGIAERISDLWLSYAKDGKTLYLTGLFFNATANPHQSAQSGQFVVVSKDDGATWHPPVFIATSTTSLNDVTGPIYLSPSITASLNHSDHAYSVASSYVPGTALGSVTTFSTSCDHGKRWSNSRTIYEPSSDLLLHGLSNGLTNDAATSANVIITLPKKRQLLNFMCRYYAKPTATDIQYASDAFPFQYSAHDIAVIHSRDGGKSWSTSAKVIATPSVNNVVFTGGYSYASNGDITGGVGSAMRTSGSTILRPTTTPSYAVNPENGNLYVVWQDGAFRRDQLPVIALSTSRDGGHHWSKPVVVSRMPTDVPNPQAFSPSVAVTKDGAVAILYSDFRNDTVNPAFTACDSWLAIYRETKERHGGSTKVGLDFDKEVRISQGSYFAQNGPATLQGVMTNGDHSFVVANKTSFYVVNTQTLRGPFAPPQQILNDTLNNAQVYVDYNYRQAPFVSVIGE